MSKMTDAVIEQALAQQPKEIRDISAGKIIQTLKDRRNFIVGEVMAYYRFISEIVSVTSSDKKELYSINRNDDGSVLLQVYKVDKDGAQSVKMYERKFDPFVTKEIRLYGFDGDDKFVVQGNSDKIRIRMIGGGGQDVFENATKSSGGIVYDKSDGNNSIKVLLQIKCLTIVPLIHLKGYPINTRSVHYFLRQDLTRMMASLWAQPLRSFAMVSAKRLIKLFISLKLRMPFSTKAVNLRYNNEFISVFGNKTDIITDIFYKGPNNTTNFFGYGVNTVYDKTKPKKFRYYRVRYDLGDISLQLRHRFSDKVMISFGPSYQFYSFDSTDKYNKVRNIVNDPIPGYSKTFLYKRQAYFGGIFSLTIDTRNSQALPDRGVNWVTTLRSLSGTNDFSYDRVTQLNSDFSVYLKLIPEWLVLANRTGGGMNLGKGFEFSRRNILAAMITCGAIVRNVLPESQSFIIRQNCA
ncbi:MAG: hypothetical protein IPI68_11760 [Chitinophagaceae bacterium]|nr:hypothetical protein [Chitinophagaceae bacterium]